MITIKATTNGNTIQQSCEDAFSFCRANKCNIEIETAWHESVMVYAGDLCWTDSYERFEANANINDGYDLIDDAMNGRR